MMARKDLKIGNRYTPRQLMELPVELMHRSIPEHTDRADPKVGAVLAMEDGTLVNTAYRGELRQGDHAEFTVLERKHRSDLLDGMVLYATLEPCAPGARSITKLGCAERIVNARIRKVYVGIEDPDPKVKGNGLEYLRGHDVETISFDSDLQKEISNANRQFLVEAVERAKKVEHDELIPAANPLAMALDNFDTKDLSTDALDRFREKLGISYPTGSVDFLSILTKWDFLKKDTRTNAVRPTGLGILLFGKNPQIPYPQSLVKFTVRSRDEDRPKIIDFDGPLVLMPEKIESYLDLHFPKVIDRSSISRKEIKELYFEVLREVIVNALVHRDYGIEQANINVRIDDDKIVVESPGRPMLPIEKLQDFTAPTFSVNPKIANVFYQMKFIEKRNLGMEELHDCAELMGVNRPIIDYVEPYLRVTLWRKAETKLSPDRKQILDFVRAKGEVSSGDYAQRFGGSTKTAQRQLTELVEEGALIRIGEKKSTRYQLKA